MDFAVRGRQVAESSVILGKTIAPLLVAAAGCVLLAAVPTSKPQSSKARSSSAKKSSAKNLPVKSSSAKKKKSLARTRHSAPRPTAQSWRAGQMQPGPERYKEFQQALKDKGYLGSEPTGNWDQDSAQALRRFQQDQKIEPTGKLDARTIIALGLGPKYNSTVPAKTAPAEP